MKLTNTEAPLESKTNKVLFLNSKWQFTTHAKKHLNIYVNITSWFKRLASVYNKGDSLP